MSVAVRVYSAHIATAHLELQVSGKYNEPFNREEYMYNL
jgi:hypothetical protein